MGPVISTSFCYWHTNGHNMIDSPKHFVPLKNLTLYLASQYQTAQMTQQEWANSWWSKIYTNFKQFWISPFKLWALGVAVEVFFFIAAFCSIKIWSTKAAMLIRKEKSWSITVVWATSSCLWKSFCTGIFKQLPCCYLCKERGTAWLRKCPILTVLSK